MALFYLEIKPDEETSFRVDKSGFREIQEGEEIISIMVTCAFGEEDVTGDIIVGSSHTKDKVTIRVNGGGISKRNYLVGILATTDAGHKRRTNVLLEVRERRR